MNNVYGIERAAENIYRVPSDSDAEKFYIVDLTSKIKTCTCTAYAIQRNRAGGAGCQGKCKHLGYVEEFLAEEKRDVKLQAKKQQAEDEAEFERLQIVEKIKATAADLSKS